MFFFLHLSIVHYWFLTCYGGGIDLLGLPFLNFFPTLLLCSCAFLQVLKHLSPWGLHAVGAWVPVSQLAEQEVAAYRQLEEEKAEDVLDELLDICRSQKV
jgi:hypothetical protein